MQREPGVIAQLASTLHESSGEGLAVDVFCNEIVQAVDENDSRRVHSLIQYAKAQGWWHTCSVWIAAYLTESEVLRVREMLLYGWHLSRASMEVI